MNATGLWPRIAVTAVVLALVGCGPSLDSPDPQERLKAVKITIDQDVLAKMSHSDSELSVRRSAAGRLNAERLRKLVVDDSLPLSARVEILNEATLPEILADIAIQTEEIQLSERAIELSAASEQLANIAINARRGEARVSAISKLNDQKQLQRVVTSRFGDAKRSAMSKITDQEFLGEFLFLGRGNRELERGERRLGAPPSATYAVQDGANYRFRISKETALIDMTVDSELCDIALNRLDDQTWLKRIVLQARARSVVLAAIGKLDQQQLASVVLNVCESEVRRAAFQRITDEAMLADIAVRSPFVMIGYEAILRITQATLAERVALESPFSVVRRLAVSRIDSIPLLEKLAFSSRNPHHETSIETREDMIVEIDGPDQKLREVARNQLKALRETGEMPKDQKMETERRFWLGRFRQEASVRIRPWESLPKNYNDEYRPLEGDLSVLTEGRPDPVLFLFAFMELQVDRPEVLAAYSSFGGPVADVACAKLITYDPIIRSRLPGLSLDWSIKETSASYDKIGRVRGHEIGIGFSFKDGASKSRIRRAFRTEFPERSSGGSMAAKIDLTEIYVQMLQRSEFLPEDLETLAQRDDPTPV